MIGKRALILIGAAALALAAGGCGTSETTRVVVPTPPDTLFTDLSFGTPETFDVITWNIENFTYDPWSDEEDMHRVTRVDHVVDAVRAFDADVIALQEITSNRSFEDVLEALDGWEGRRASQYTGWHELAYLWNSETVTMTSEPYEIFTGDWNSFPRSPLVLECEFQGRPLILINNHLKCCGDGEIAEDPDYDNDGDIDDEETRRLNAVVQLEEWIREQHPDEAVILLGDLNDRLTDARDDNVFNVFLDATDDYVFADMDLAEGSSGSWSFRYSSHIDHILLTDELFADFASPGVEVITFPLDDYLDTGWNGYETNLSDHLPVGLKLPLAP